MNLTKSDLQVKQRGLEIEFTGCPEDGGNAAMSCWPTTEEENESRYAHALKICASHLTLGRKSTLKGKQTGDVTEEPSVGGKVYSNPSAHGHGDRQ